MSYFIICYKTFQILRAKGLLIICTLIGLCFVGCYAPYSIYPEKGCNYDTLLNNNPRVFLSIIFSDLQLIPKPGEIVEQKEVDKKVEKIEQNTISGLNRILQPQICYPVKVDSLNFKIVKNYIQTIVEQLDELNRETEKLSIAEVRKLYRLNKLDSLRKQILIKFNIDKRILDKIVKTNNYKYILILKINGKYKTRKKQRQEEWEDIGNILLPMGLGSYNSAGEGVFNMFVINVQTYKIDYYYKTDFYYTPHLTMDYVLEDAFSEYIHDRSKIK